MLDYSFNEFVLILYFVCYYLFRGRFKKIWYWVYKSKDNTGKINNSFKISKNKLNIRMVTFQGI